LESAMSNLGSVNLLSGDFDNSLKFSERSLELSHAAGDVSSRIGARGQIARVKHCRGDRDEARKLFKKCEKMERRYPPTYKFLSGDAGLYYCDFLLEQGAAAEVAERARWMMDTDYVRRVLRISAQARSLLATALAHSAGPDGESEVVIEFERSV